MSLLNKFNRLIRGNPQVGNTTQLLGYDYLQETFIPLGTQEAFLSRATPLPSRLVFTPVVSDFISSTISGNGLVATAIGSGSIAAGTSSARHPGVVTISDSTTANGGGRIDTESTAFLLAGGERIAFAFQYNSIKAGATAQLGFRDNTAVGTPTDGAWLNIARVASDTILSGQTNDNTGVATTATTFTMTVDTWYRGIVTVLDGATGVLFELFSEDGVPLWSDSLATKIPTGAGRFTGAGVIATESSTDAAAVLLTLDYLELRINRTLFR
jgi:hypothetical protein